MKTNRCQLWAPVTWCALWFLRSGAVSSCAGRRDSHFAELSLSPQPAERMSGSMSGLPPRRFVLHAWSAWTSVLWSDVSPPSVIWERMRLLFFATLCGVLLDAGRLQVGDCVPVSVSSVRAQLGAHVPKNKCLDCGMCWRYTSFYLHSCATEAKCHHYSYFIIYLYCIHCTDILNHLILECTVPSDFILMPLHLENRTSAFW